MSFVVTLAAIAILVRLWRSRRGPIAGASWVYLVADESRAGVFKIGYSGRYPTARFAEIERGSRRPVRLICAGPGSRGLERYLQGLFPTVAAAGMEGPTEWRSLADADVVLVRRILTGR